MSLESSIRLTTLHYVSAMHMIIANNNNGWTALHDVSSRGHLDTAKCLRK